MFWHVNGTIINQSDSLGGELLDIIIHQVFVLQLGLTQEQIGHPDVRCPDPSQRWTVWCWGRDHMRKTVGGDIGGEGTGSVDLSWGPLLEDVPTEWRALYIRAHNGCWGHYPHMKVTAGRWHIFLERLRAWERIVVCSWDNGDTKRC